MQTSIEVLARRIIEHAAFEDTAPAVVLAKVVAKLTTEVEGLAHRG